jgi:hypothetical protein
VKSHSTASVDPQNKLQAITQEKTPPGASRLPMADALAKRFDGKDLWQNFFVCTTWKNTLRLTTIKSL